MTEETGAAAPVIEQAVPAPAAAEQATQPDTSVAQADTATENDEVQGSEAESTEAKRLTRNQRLQRKAARLSTMVAEQAAEIERLRTSATAPDASEPKENDYNGDWTKYQADYAAWKAAKSVEQKLNEREQRDAQSRLNERLQEAAEDFEERSAEYKSKVPDFDATIEAFVSSGGRFSQTLVEELRDSDAGPALAYQLAKNPKLVQQINQMSARDVAREIGRLEAKISSPQPRKQTQAPQPIAPVSGGAASPAKDPAKMTEKEYVAWRKSGGGGKPAF